MRTRPFLQPFALLVLLLAACGGDDEPARDAGAADAAVVIDAGDAVDAGDVDAGIVEDAGSPEDAEAPADSGAPTDGGGGAPGVWEEHCTVGGPERAAGCGDGFDVDGCLAHGECVVSRFVPEAVEPLVECLDSRACGESDDPCYLFEELGLEPSAAFDQFQTDCLEKRITCPPAMRFSDDLCFPGLLTDEVIAEADTCLDLGCGDVQGCLLGLYTCD